MATFRKTSRSRQQRVKAVLCGGGFVNGISTVQLTLHYPDARPSLLELGEDEAADLYASLGKMLEWISGNKEKK